MTVHASYHKRFITFITAATPITVSTSMPSVPSPQPAPPNSVWHDSFRVGPIHCTKAMNSPIVPVDEEEATVALANARKCREELQMAYSATLYARSNIAFEELFETGLLSRDLAVKPITQETTQTPLPRLTEGALLQVLELQHQLIQQNIDLERTQVSWVGDEEPDKSASMGSNTHYEKRMIVRRDPYKFDANNRSGDDEATCSRGHEDGEDSTFCLSPNTLAEQHSDRIKKVGLWKAT